MSTTIRPCTIWRFLELGARAGQRNGFACGHARQRARQRDLAAALPAPSRSRDFLHGVSRSRISNRRAGRVSTQGRVRHHDFGSRVDREPTRAAAPALLLQFRVQHQRCRRFRVAGPRADADGAPRNCRPAPDGRQPTRPRHSFRRSAARARRRARERPHQTDARGTIRTKPIFRSALQAWINQTSPGNGRSRQPQPARSRRSSRQSTAAGRRPLSQRRSHRRGLGERSESRSAKSKRGWNGHADRPAGAHAAHGVGMAAGRRRACRPTQMLKQAQLARAALQQIYRQHFQPAQPETVLNLTAPLHAKLLASPTTIKAAVRASRVPERMLSGVFRRVARLPRRLKLTQPGAPTVLSRVSSGAILIVPPPEPPGGMVSIDQVTNEVSLPAPSPPATTALTKQQLIWLLIAILILALIVGFTMNWALALAVIDRRCGNRHRALAETRSAAVAHTSRCHRASIRKLHRPSHRGGSRAPRVSDHGCRSRARRRSDDRTRLRARPQPSAAPPATCSPIFRPCRRTARLCPRWIFRRSQAPSSRASIPSRPFRAARNRSSAFRALSSGSPPIRLSRSWPRPIFRSRCTRRCAISRPPTYCPESNRFRRTVSASSRPITASSRPTWWG